MPRIGGSKTVLFHEGDEGVEFEIKRPLEEHHADSPFYVAVYLSNEGAHGTKGMICLYGLDEDKFSGFSDCDECEDFDLSGVSYYGEQKVEGDYETIEFGEYSIDKESIKFYDKKDEYRKESDRFTVTSSIVYDYLTYGIIDACIREDIYDEDGCDYEDKNMLKGVSGAPIQINSVKEEIIRSDAGDYKLIFDIEIENEGNGFVTGNDECGSLDKEGEIEVKLLNAPGGGEEVECASVKLKDDKAVAHCVVEGVEGKDYKTDVTVILTYKYKEIKSKIFKIMKNE